MPILQGATAVTATMSRSPTNALRIQLTTPDGTELAQARQKGGAAVLLGFKNGGRSTYTVSSADGEEMTIVVAATTTISMSGNLIGRIVPADGAAHIETAAGAVLAVVRPHTGSKADHAWQHRLLTPAGVEFGVLTLMTAHTGWNDLDAELTQWVLNQYPASLKAPSNGVLLELSAPVHPVLGDLLAAACVDFAVLPRGYIA